MSLFLHYLIWFMIISAMADIIIEQHDLDIELKELFRKTSVPTISFELGEQYLGRMKEIYTHESKKEAKSPRRKLILKLAKLQNYECDNHAKFIIKYDEIVHEYGSYANIVELADHFKELYIWRCLMPKIRTYYEKVSARTDCEIGDIDGLLNEVKLATKRLTNEELDMLKKPFFSLDALVVGLYTYLQNKSPELKAKAEDKQHGITQKEFLNYYQPIVEAACGSRGFKVSKKRKLKIEKVSGGRAWEMKLFREPRKKPHCFDEYFYKMSEYYILEINSQIMKEFDEFTREWFVKASICLDITTESNYVFDHVFDLVKAKKDSKGCLYHFFLRQ